MIFEKVTEAIQKGYFDLPFYREKYGTELSGIRTEQQFLKLPFTEKEELRNTSPFSRSRTDPEQIYGIYSSNGTTGKKTFYVHSLEDHRKQAEFVKAFYTAIGMEKGGLGAVLGPVGSPIMGHCMVWEFHAMQMGVTLCPEPSPENILEIIGNLPVTDLATLPQVASLLAERPEWREAAAASAVQRLVLGGDFLSEARRKLLEETWKAEVYNSFGMSEIFGPIGNECREKNGFHYFDKDIYIEVISPDTGEPVLPGEVGIGVYTTLWDKGFPLLRYWSGDLIRMIPEPCPCGCGLPRFSYFGRMTDCVRREDGTWISPGQVEELTLPDGLIHCQIRLEENGAACLVYDQDGPAPGNRLLEKLKDLLFCAKMTKQALPLEQMVQRGFKPKYLLKQGEQGVI